MRYDRSDVESILHYARRLRGKRLDQVIDGLAESPTSSARTKGYVGHLYERFFGIPRNSLSAPDFTLAGVELKIVPMKGAASARRVKERTSISMINYHDVAVTAFRDSHLEAKTRAILFIFYEWIRDVPMSRFRTLDVSLWQRGEFDELLIKDAYSYVTKKVLEGEAHALSEGATQGVGAATKGAAGARVKQPYSDILARPRAFAFKPSFTGAIWERAQTTRLESIGDLESITVEEFEERFIARLSEYRNMTVAQIEHALGIPPSVGKSRLAMVSRRMAGAKEGGRDIEELKKMGVTMRTVRIDDWGRPREDTSFPKIDFLDVVEEEWESSSLREQLSHMLFVVFRHRRKDDLEDARFETAFFWRFTSEEERTLRREWETFVRHIKVGDVARKPQAAETQILHIRPHARDAKDTAVLPNGTEWVKSSFWLNRDFVQLLIQHQLP